MQVSKDELLHIANLADITISEDEINQYLINLEEILNFAEVVNKAPIEGLEITIGANERKNIFRKDEVKEFEDNEALLKNAPTKDLNMFKIPKVINT